jgi:hypothetical protein
MYGIEILQRTGDSAIMIGITSERPGYRAFAGSQISSPPAAVRLDGQHGNTVHGESQCQ